MVPTRGMPYQLLHALGRFDGSLGYLVAGRLGGKSCSHLDLRGHKLLPNHKDFRFDRPLGVSGHQRHQIA